jgi:peroxiredoxin
VIFSFVSCKKKSNKVIIKGEISNLETPYIIATHFSADSIVIDTIKTNPKGSFKYETKIDTLSTFTLYFNDYQSSTVVFADKNDKISLDGDANLSDLILVKGNEINEDLSTFKKENEALIQQRFEIINNYRSENNRNNGVLSENEKIAKINSLNHELMQRAETFIQANPEKIASAILINEFFRDIENPQSLERVLGYLKGKALEWPPVSDLKIYTQELKESAEGANMPYFQLTDINDKTIRSTDFASKYLVMSFLSASGSESHETVQILKKEFEKVNKDSVRFLSIYIDSDIYPITTIGNDSLPWTAVAEKRSWASDIVRSYHIPFVPYNILISPEGKIQIRNIAASQISSTIAKNGKSDSIIRDN